MTIRKCSVCGLCNPAGSLFRLVGRETLGARFAAWQIKQGELSPALYRYCLDGSAMQACPAAIDLDEEVIKARAELVRRGKETKANRKMIATFRMYKTPHPDE